MGDRRTVAEQGRERDHGGHRPRRVAMISMHTSPTAVLGQRANGGLNVCVRELCTQLSQRGVATDVFTRGLGPDCPRIEHLPPPRPVSYLPPRPLHLEKDRLLED